MFYRLIM
ncbi:hypothetical protein MTR67_052221 [Solanum verrucosum]|nr:hypothetical protein MTR67_052221 [Solanum verrucosum]